VLDGEIGVVVVDVVVVVVVVVAAVLRRREGLVGPGGVGFGGASEPAGAVVAAPVVVEEVGVGWVVGAVPSLAVCCCAYAVSCGVWSIANRYACVGTLGSCCLGGFVAVSMRQGRE
jgi:hypothetical protein